ncbi:MAG: hypothetical protein AAGG50_07870 [Bacteroidota bacterium]
MEKFAPRWVLSAAVRNGYELQDSGLMAPASVLRLLETAREPSSPFESVDLLIRHIHRKTDRPDGWVTFRLQWDFPLVYARDQNELHFYLQFAGRLGFVESDGTIGGTSYRLSIGGWQRLNELEQAGRKSDQAFVAMWFDGTMTPAYTDGIAPALRTGGYQPLHMAFQEHNEKIDDRIIAEIRRSGLLVADFTGHRGGVYFEAGFALGLGIPVIWTCREDEINQAHFDTRQYNYIGWTTPEDLKVKLTNRILATLPRSES